MSSFWLHGEEGGAPSIITTGHHCFIVRADADAEIVAEGGDLSSENKNALCHGHDFTQDENRPLGKERKLFAGFTTV